jgi:SAM-dependent methyltransferase
MADDQNPIAGLFDRAAASYDRVGVDFFQPIAAGLLGELDPRPGESALDVGCGRGAVLFPLARAVQPGGTATGIDVSEAMVAATRAEAAVLGIDVDVRVGDAVLAGDLGPFDLVASSLVAFFLPDPGRALATWRERLVDGGRVGISTFGPYSGEWRTVDPLLEQYRPPQLRDPRATTASSPFASDAGVELLVRDAGFSDVRTVTTTIPVRFADEDQWYEWSWSVGQRGLWERMSETERTAVRATAYERLQGCRDAEGRIGFDQVVRYTMGRAGGPGAGVD